MTERFIGIHVSINHGYVTVVSVHPHQYPLLLEREKDQSARALERSGERGRDEGPVLATEDDRGGFCVAAGSFASFHARVDVLYHRA